MAREFQRSYKYANATQGKQGQLVYLSAAETVDITTGSAVFPIGVLMNEPKQNETANLRMGEVGEVIRVAVDGTVAIAVGDLIKANNAGKGVKATKNIGYQSALGFVIGQATEACSVANGVIGVVWRPFETSL